MTKAMACQVERSMHGLLQYCVAIREEEKRKKKKLVERERKRKGE
jgi:hypothetical protein